MESVGERVRRIRESMGLTQTELSKKAGLGDLHTPVSRIETGISKRPSHKNINKISRALGVTAAYLRYGDRFDVNSLPKEVKDWLSSRRNVDWLLENVIRQLPVEGDIPTSGLEYETKVIPMGMLDEVESKQK